jgi:hypothetical protein
VLLMYLHGSEAENELDVWLPRAVEGTTPPIVKALSGATVKSKTVRVYAHVTNVMPLGHVEEHGILFTPERMKLRRRCSEVSEALADFVNAGYPREQIFLAGHSLGGWVALRLLAMQPNLCGGAIAFAPATAGPRADRNSWWTQRRTEAIAELTAVASIPALVYAVKGDEWEEPPYLDFLKPLVDYREVTPGKGRLTPKTPYYFHCGIFNSAFASKQTEIVNFLEQRLPNSCQK